MQKILQIQSNDRNLDLEQFLKSDNDYLILYLPGTEFSEYNLEVLGKRTLCEAFLEAHKATRYPAMYAYNTYLESEQLSATPYTLGSSDILDFCVFLTREAVQTAGYFNNKLSGKYQMKEYLARINRLAGHCPEHFVALKHSYRYVRYSKVEKFDAKGEKLYTKLLTEKIIPGLDLTRKQKF